MTDELLLWQLPQLGLHVLKIKWKYRILLRITYGTR